MNRTSITPNQEKQYRRFVEDAAKRGADLALKKVQFDRVSIQKFFGRGGEFNTAIAEVIVAKTRELSDLSPYLNLIMDWENFYRDLGVAVDFSSLVIPKKQEGYDRLIIEADGLTPQKVYDICGRLFKCWKWTDKSLDEVITHSDRVGLHAVWVKERVEADEELKNLSANQLKELGIAGITFNEHGLYGAKYFKETGKRLDISNWTLCSGSRHSDGDVPRVRWPSRYGEMGVYCCPPSDAHDVLRSRQVVS